MSNITKHVEQLVKELGDRHNCTYENIDQAARLMTAMAKAIEAERTWGHGPIPDSEECRCYSCRHVAQARRELDAMIPKEDDHAR